MDTQHQNMGYRNQYLFFTSPKLYHEQCIIFLLTILFFIEKMSHPKERICTGPKTVRQTVNVKCKLHVSFYILSPVSDEFLV